MAVFEMRGGIPQRKALVSTNNRYLLSTEIQPSPQQPKAHVILAQAEESMFGRLRCLGSLSG